MTDTFPLDVDYGLVHLDLDPWNMLLHRGTVRAIDFDSCQYAPFLYDMAMPLTYLDDRQDYDNLKAGFLRGYAHERCLPPDHEAGLEFFMVVRALDMITWVLSWPRPTRKKCGPETLAGSLARLRRYDAH
jgi:Ser/Thr protein kinase RdoA (MazF antagonist)